MLTGALNRSRREHTAHASSSRGACGFNLFVFGAPRLVCSGCHCGVARAVPADHQRRNIRCKAKWLIANPSRIRTSIAASPREVHVIWAWAGARVSEARRCNELPGNGLVVVCGRKLCGHRLRCLQRLGRSRRPLGRCRCRRCLLGRWQRRLLILSRRILRRNGKALGLL